MSHSAGQCDSSGMEESLNARIVRDDAPEAAMRRLKDSPKHALEVTLGYFDDPLIGACDRFYQSDEWASVRALLPVRKGRALDLGAGRGIASYALARDGWDVTASEPDTSDLIGAGAIRRLAPEASLSINVVEEFGENLSFSDAVFDLVYCRQVLHHADNLYAMCREIARILKPGGIFLATREHVISKPEDLPAFLEKHLLHRLHGRENAHLLREYTDSIENAGLRLLRALGPMESVINYYQCHTMTGGVRVPRHCSDCSDTEERNCWRMRNTSPEGLFCDGWRQGSRAASIPPAACTVSWPRRKAFGNIEDPHLQSEYKSRGA